MSHYKANLRGYRVQSLRSSSGFRTTSVVQFWPELDEDTARDTLDRGRKIGKRRLRLLLMSIRTASPLEVGRRQGRDPRVCQAERQSFQRRRVGAFQSSRRARWDSRAEYPFLGLAGDAPGGKHDCSVLQRWFPIRQSAVSRRAQTSRRSSRVCGSTRAGAGTMILTEPDAGSDVWCWQDQGHLTMVMERGTSKVSSGSSPAASMTSRKTSFIWYWLAPKVLAQGPRACPCFVVPKFLVNDDGSLGERNGVYATNIEKKMGLKGSTTCEMTFGLDEPADRVSRWWRS